VLFSIRARVGDRVRKERVSGIARVGVRIRIGVRVSVRARAMARRVPPLH